MARRQTAAIGEENRNGQRLVRKTNRPGNHRNQRVWVLQCAHPECDHHMYGANGCDFWERHCPRCQGGAAGLDFEERRS
jgi:hypothetical protein